MAGFNTQNRSKDLPGKDGYSYNDRQKLYDAVKNYSPVKEQKGCPLTILSIVFNLGTVLLAVYLIFSVL